MPQEPREDEDFFSGLFFLAAKGSKVIVQNELRDKRIAICQCHSKSNDWWISNHPSRRPPTDSIFFFLNCASILNGLCDYSAFSAVKEAGAMREVFFLDWCQTLLGARTWFVTRS